jgi:hypothetical protein
MVGVADVLSNIGRELGISISAGGICVVIFHRDGACNCSLCLAKIANYGLQNISLLAMCIEPFGMPTRTSGIKSPGEKFLSVLSPSLIAPVIVARLLIASSGLRSAFTRVMDRQAATAAMK